MQLLRKIIIIWSFIFLCSIFLIDNNPAFSDEKRIFSVGWEPWAPYLFENEQKNITGLDADLLKMIINKMNCETKFHNIPWKRLLSYVRRGHIDLATGASKTSEREEYANYSDSYRTESTVLFVLKGYSSKYPFKKLSDIKKSKFQLGVTNGYYCGEEFEKLMKDDAFKKHVQGVINDNTNIKKALRGRIDGYIGDKYAGIAAIKEEGARNQFEIHPMNIFSTDIYVLFSKKSTTKDELNRFNKALKILKENGELDDMLKKYIN